MKKKKLICGLLSASMVLTIGGLTSVYAADTETLADYPEYKEIVQKYYVCFCRMEYQPVSGK